MADAKLPGVGKVPKPALAATGAVAAGILAYAYWKHRNNASAASTATPADSSASATDTSAIDPATGVPYADEFGSYGSGGYSGIGVFDPSTGGTFGTGYGTGTVQTVSTNAAWAQAAELYLTQVAGWQDSHEVASALGKVLTGQYITPSQLEIFNAAVAFEGNPPQGYPPLNTTPPVGPPSTGPVPPVSGLHVTSTTKNSIGLQWSATTGVDSYLVSSSTGHSFNVTGTQYRESNLHSNSSYSYTVQAIKGGRAGPRSSHVTGHTSK